MHLRIFQGSTDDELYGSFKRAIAVLRAVAGAQECSDCG